MKTPQVSNFTKKATPTTPKKEVIEKEETDDIKPEIVRSSRSPSPEFSSKNVSSAYEFFSTLSTKKENGEEKKRKEIGIGKSQTTTKMLSRFRELEQKKNDDEREIKPLKEFTPERDGGGRRFRQSSTDSEEEDSESEDEGVEREEDQCLVEVSVQKLHTFWCCNKIVIHRRASWLVPDTYARNSKSGTNLKRLSRGNMRARISKVHLWKARRAFGRSSNTLVNKKAWRRRGSNIRSLDLS